MIYKVIIAISFLFIFGCAKTSSPTGEKVRIQNDKYCVPEDELLASGIVGGTTVVDQDRDSKNAIMIYADGSVCTATAIAPHILLTAAHCLAAAEKTVAYLRASISCESGFDSRRDSIAVSRFIAHEDYKSDESSSEFSINDVALVFLKEDLPSGYPIFKLADPSLVKAEPLYFWGFGQIQNAKGNGGIGILRKTTVTADSYTINLKRKKIMIDQRKGHGICHGDSGGPGFVKQNGVLKILGIVSYVEDPKGTTAEDPKLCNADSYLTIANSFLPWIKQQLKNQNETLPN